MDANPSRTAFFISGRHADRHMLLIADRHQRIADDTDDAFVFVNSPMTLRTATATTFTNWPQCASMYSTDDSTVSITFSACSRRPSSTPSR